MGLWLNLILTNAHLKKGTFSQIMRAHASGRTIVGTSLNACFVAVEHPMFHCLQKASDLGNNGSMARGISKQSDS